MNGLEAIELMKQGKMIKSGIWIYSMDSDGVIWLKTELHTGWVEAHRFDILANEYEEYIESKTLTGWDRTEHWEDVEGFYSIAECDVLADRTSYNHVLNQKCYENANYFSTKEKAEEINFKQMLFRKLQRFSDENGGNEIDWENTNQKKYCILYCHSFKELQSDFTWVRQNQGQIYFISKEIAEKAIELFRDELIKYFTHDWSGKDETPINLNSEER